jgi:hypothetical protein
MDRHALAHSEPNARAEHPAATCAQLLERIDRLERSGRRVRLTAIGMASLGAIGCLALVAPTAVRTLTAETLTVETLRGKSVEIVDDAGKVRARLGVGRSGDPSLALLDEAGVPQVTLALGSFPRTEDRDRPARRANGQPTGASDGALTAVLRLGSKDGEPAVEIGAGERLRALRLRDDFGDERIELRVGPYVRPDLRPGATGDLVEASVRLKSPDERLAIELGVEPISSRRPADRTSTANAALVEEATPFLTMYGWCEDPIFLLSNWSGDEPSLDLWEYRGQRLKSIVSLPSSGEPAPTRSPSQP